MIFDNCWEHFAFWAFVACPNDTEKISILLSTPSSEYPNDFSGHCESGDLMAAWRQSPCGGFPYDTCVL